MSSDEDKPLLVVKIKLVGEERVIYFRKNNDPQMINEDFCHQNDLDVILIEPITSAIKRAIEALEYIMSDSMDSFILYGARRIWNKLP